MSEPRIRSEELLRDTVQTLCRDGGLAQIHDIAALLGISERTAGRYVRMLRTRGLVRTAAGVRGVWLPENPPPRTKRCPSCGQKVETT